LPEGQVELARRDSSYQMLRVVEDHTQSVPLRFLQVNEGFDSFQSVWQAELGLLPDGFYYNDFLLPASWSTAAGPWRVLVLGLGAGTALRVLEGEPRLAAEFTGIELDPGVVALGHEFFDLPRGENLRLGAGVDARVALRAVHEPVEQIVLDCYSNQVEIPAHLCTLEFFRELRARLAEGGWLTANLGGFDFDDPVVAAVASTCARAFESGVLLVRVPQSRNYILLARRDGELPWTGTALAAATQPSVLALGPRLLPGFARRVDPDPAATVLTDDRCPIERLQQRSIQEARSRRLAALGS
jgi:spermidine synthase